MVINASFGRGYGRYFRTRNVHTRSNAQEGYGTLCGKTAFSRCDFYYNLIRIERLFARHSCVYAPVIFLRNGHEIRNCLIFMYRRVTPFDRKIYRLIRRVVGNYRRFYLHVDGLSFLVSHGKTFRRKRHRFRHFISYIFVKIFGYIQRIFPTLFICDNHARDYRDYGNYRKDNSLYYNYLFLFIHSLPPILNSCAFPWKLSLRTKLYLP